MCLRCYERPREDGDGDRRLGIDGRILRGEQMSKCRKRGGLVGLVCTLLALVSFQAPKAWGEPLRLALGGAGEEGGGDAGGGGVIEDVESWTDVLPLGKSIVGEHAKELPAPIGLTFGYFYMKQGVTVEKINAVKINGVVIPSSVLKDASIQSFTVANTAFDGRIDAWVFPFLNLYALGGYNFGSARLRVDIPGVLTTGLIKKDYTAWTFGGGGTLAAAYEFLFASLDTNYTTTGVPGILNSAVNGLSVTPRAGVRYSVAGLERIGGLTGVLWMGAMYMHVNQHQYGDTSIRSIKSIAFDADVRLTNPWNGLFGTALALGRHFAVVIEGGVIGQRQQFLFALSGRI